MPSEGADLVLTSWTSVILQVCLASLAVVFTLQYMWNRKWRLSSTNLPPGSMGYFVVGETLQLIFNPTQYYRKVKNYGDICKTHIFGSPTVRVAGSSNVCPIYSNENGICEAKSLDTIRILLGSNSISLSSGAKHKENRKQVLSAIKKGSLQNLIPRIQKIIEDTLQLWCKEQSVLVYKKTRLMTFHSAWEVIIGLHLSKEDALEYLDTFEQFFGGFFTLPFNIPGFPFNKALKAKKVLHQRIEDAVAKGESLTESSILGTMLQHQRNLGIEPDTNDIKDKTTELLFAGFETLSSAVTSLTMILAKEDEVRNKLVEEMNQNGILNEESSMSFETLSRMTYLNSVIKELLRLYPPVGGSFRTAAKSFQLQGYTIPEGWTVLPSIMATHKNANLDNHDEFLPERWSSDLENKSTDFNYIPFGAGQRICIGREYAKLFLRVYSVCLLRMCNIKLLSENPEFIPVPILHPTDFLPAKFLAKE